MLLVLYIAIIIVTFYLMSQVTDNYFIISLDAIAKKWKLSHDAAGATLMAVGSSAPELFVSLAAVFMPGDHAAIGMGTIIGSALFNILVIIGAVAIVRKTTVAWQNILRDMFFYFVAVVLLFFAFRDGAISLQEALVFVSCFVVYVFVVINWRKWFSVEDEQEDIERPEIVEVESFSLFDRIMHPFAFIISKLFPPPKYYGWVFIISIAIIAALSWVLVNTAIGIAEVLNVPEVIIALTVLAIGTSVPDLISSVIVARQGRGGMGISNAIGSNIFDIFIGMGLPWALALIFLDIDFLAVSGENLHVSIVILIAAFILIIALFMFNKWVINRRIGAVLIVTYILYLAWSVGQIFLF